MRRFAKGLGYLVESEASEGVFEAEIDGVSRRCGKRRSGGQGIEINVVEFGLFGTKSGTMALY